MRIVSVNYSEIKTIQYQGKSVTTGIFKKPSQQPVTVNYAGIIGDAQADLINHGGSHKAVYGFSADHYPYWKEQLQRAQLDYGTFGENLTITELNEAHICIGDQFKIGECVLEVSQPRVPCFKLGIALDNKQGAKLFTKSYNTGVYFRVITPGVITVNDTMTKIKSVKPSVSVRSLFKAKFDKTDSQRDRVFEQARELSTLAPEWQKKIG